MQESMNKDQEELKNKHTETSSTITGIENTLEGINSRISEAKEWISNLEDKMLEITFEEQNKVKIMKRTMNYKGPRRRREKERVWEKFWRL